MSFKISVTVLRSGRPLQETTDSPVRRRPDGLSGIVFGGRVYPLRGTSAKASIELDDDSIPKANCPTFVNSAASLVFANVTRVVTAPDRWHVETNKFGNYLVFDGDEDLAQSVVDALEDSGMAVRRWDTSYRAADDGHKYDWFARLETKDDRDTVVARLHEVFAGVEPGTGDTEADDADADLAQLEAAVAAQAAQIAANRAWMDSVAEKLEVIEDRTVAVVAERDQALSDLNDANARVVEASARLAQEQALVEELQRALSVATARDVSPDVDAALEIAEEAERDKRSAVAEAEGLRTKEAELSAQLHTALGQLEAQRTALTAAERQFQEAEVVRASARPRTRATDAWTRAWRRLALHDSALDCLNGEEFEEIFDLVRVIGLIDAGETVGKKLKNCDAWEIDKVATGVKGRETMGRVYWRRRDDKVEVFAHHKQNDTEQERFIRLFVAR